METQDYVNFFAGTTGLRTQDALNRLAGLPGDRSKQECWNVLAGTRGLSSQAAANIWAGNSLSPTYWSIQECCRQYYNNNVLNGIMPTAVYNFYNNTYIENDTVTNNLLYSQEFDNAVWTPTRSSVTADTTTAPDGTTTADLLTEDTSAAATHVIVQSITGPANVGDALTFSAYFKPNGRIGIKLLVPSTIASSTPQAIFRTNTSAVTTSGTVLRTSFVDVGGGWFRASMTVVATSGAGVGQFTIRLDNGTTDTYTGDGVSGAYIWGAQVQFVAALEPYVATTASPATTNFGLRTTPWAFDGTRTTNATMVDSQGRLVYAPHNHVNNTSFRGWAAGVVGSGGTMGTGWQLQNSSGLTLTVLGVGEDSFGKYIELNAAGVATATASIQLRHTTFTGAVSAFAGMTGYTENRMQLTNNSGTEMSQFRLELVGLNSGGAVVTGQTGQSGNNLTNELKTAQFTFSDTTVARYTARALTGAHIVSDSYDYTMRIYADSKLCYVGPDGVQPFYETTGTGFYGGRWDYNPQTLTLRGFLREQGSSNLARSTVPFGDTQQITATNGTNTTGASIVGSPSVRYTGDGISGAHFFNIQSIATAPAASSSHTVSAYVRYVDTQYIQLTVSANFAATDCYVNYDLTTGQAVGNGAGASNIFIHAQGNDTYRIGFTFTTIGVPTTGSPGIIGLATSAGATRLATTSQNTSVDVSNFQLEAGTVATSYIPAYTTSLGRNLDLLGTGAGSWLNQTKGTIYGKVVPSNLVSAAARIACISDNTTSNLYAMIRTTLKKLQSHTAVGGVGTFSPTTANDLDDFTVCKTVGRFNATSARLCLNGGTVVANTGLTIPTSGYVTIDVGSSAGNASPFNGWIQEIRYYADDSASDAQLQAITT